MAVFERLVKAAGAIALAVSFIGLGFAVCVLPATTHAVANGCSDDVTSPFTRSQLVRVADATRDYAFGSHDQAALYRTIADVDAEYLREITVKGGQAGKGFPAVEGLPADASIAQYAAAFSDASDQYCYSPEVIRHLDDCHAVALGAYAALIVAVLLAVACLVFTGIRGTKRGLGTMLMAAGIAVLALFALAGLWALVDFNGLFATFHMLFFSQGNWTFPADSLLICALPTAFWMGMGSIWLAVTIAASILCLGIGLLLRKKAKA